MKTLWLSRAEHDALIYSKWVPWLKGGKWSMSGVEYSLPEAIHDEISEFLWEDN